ncbi:MAG: zinc ribbon domain-containing protein [Clostridia bacterium]|nr:zinc ribbon domain-containing protein [Clostridia bacterium]MDY6184353.1 zinc ribbon domain-containing protein [Eubacteriales bacterium]
MNTQQHQNTKRTLRVLGVVLLAFGAVLAMTGFVNFALSISDGEMPSLFWMLFLGFPLLAFGLMLLLMSLRQEITRYVKNETIPVINEAGEEIAPAVRAVAAAAREGVIPTEHLTCGACGAENPAGNSYCGKCGAPLARTCPACGASVKAGDAYCGQCGKKL